MQLNRNRLYTLLFILCLAGYIWLYVSYTTPEKDIGVCFIKNVTGIPCPSCGSTRAVTSLLHGHFLTSIYWNPFGLIIVLIMIFAPIWILYDIVLKKETLYLIYQGTESFFKRKTVAGIAISLVVLNWVWNIYKGL